MIDLRLVILLSFILVSCNRTQKPKIEKFTWIRHNLNRIHDISELQARYYLSYHDSSKTLFYAFNNSRIKQVEYFESPKNDSLSGLIFKNFYKKTFSQCIIGEPTIYDGDFYCIIYKFENEQEHFINYLPFAISDSLKSFVDYLERLVEMSTNKRANPFDINSELIQYKDSIIDCFPPVPPPAELGPKVKFTKPKHD
ncbi:MAG TPA: hypothetical protein DCM02_10805 [Flavobacterium sp.]|nr:hypothetical protein [Flavobacterium sp.]